MAQFKAFAPQVEVNGQTVLAVLNGMGPVQDLGHKILAQHGIKNPLPGLWYSQQAWLDAFRTIAETVGPMTLYSIGQAIPNSAQWPTQITTVEMALASIDTAYHLNHRGGEIGSYQFNLVGPRSGKMICHNPYPSEFDQGIIYAVARKFAPLGSFPWVKLDESAPTRKKGSDSCTFLVAW